MPDPLRVLFVCLHGSAKSVIAAEHFRRLALARSYAIETMPAGVEPDDQIPPHVVRGLEEDGFDAPRQPPQMLTDSVIVSADVVVSFGCAVEGPVVVRWDDVPAVSDDYSAARDVIVARLETLLADIVSGRPPTVRD